MIISTLESQDFNFQKSDEDMRVAFQIETDNLPVVISVVTDVERQLIRIVAGYSIVFPEDKRVDGAIAACVTNRNLVAGGFDYDYESGEIVFRISSSFAGSVISPRRVYVSRAPRLPHLPRLRPKTRQSRQRSTHPRRLPLYVRGRLTTFANKIMLSGRDSYSNKMRCMKDCVFTYIKN